MMYIRFSDLAHLTTGERLQTLIHDIFLLQSLLVRFEFW